MQETKRLMQTTKKERGVKWERGIKIASRQWKELWKSISDSEDWPGVSPPTCCVRRPPAPQRAPPLEAPKPGPGGSAAGPLGSETATTPVGGEKKNHQYWFANNFHWQKIGNSEQCRSAIICGTKQQIKALSHSSPASAGDGKTHITSCLFS